jgi:hypothetical protein
MDYLPRNLEVAQRQVQTADKLKQLDSNKDHYMLENFVSEYLVAPHSSITHFINTYYDCMIVEIHVVL